MHASLQVDDIRMLLNRGKGCSYSQLSYQTVLLMGGDFDQIFW